MPMFDRTLFHVMRVIMQEHGARWSAHVPDLTKPQYAVLEALDQIEEMDQVALGRASATSKATLTEMLNRMEKRGLIERRPDPDDARQKLVRLTDAGRAKVRDVHPLADKVSNSMTDGLSALEREALLDMLGKITDSFENRD